MESGWHFILGIAVGVIAAYYIGEIFSFFPFTDDSSFIIRAVGFCTLIVCVVVAICTNLIISEIRKNRPTDAETEK